MELEKIMINALKEIQESGLVEKTVKEKIESTIKSIINDLFRDYSDFGKDLKEKLGEAVKVNLNKIDLPVYNVMISNYIKEQTTAVMSEQYKKLIDERLSKILVVEEKREWKLSEIIEKIIEGSTESAAEDGWEKITLIFDNWYADYWHICIDPEPGKSKYDCSIKIDISESELGGVEVGEYTTKNSEKDKIFPNLSGVEALFFRLYSQGCKVTVDEEACEDAMYYPDPYG